MVQFKQYKARHKRVNEADNYWKLGPQARVAVGGAQTLMYERNYYYNKNVSKDRTMQLLRRSERGLLSYDGCSRLELESFHGSRGLDFHRDDQKWELVKALEQADDDSRFGKFMALPPELRNRIYVLHLRELEVPRKFRQPPLCRTSRALRQETLSLFYSIHPITVCFCFQPYYDGNDTDLEAKATHATRAFFKEMPTQSLSRIEQLRIEVKGWGSPDLSDKQGMTLWKVDLSGGLQGADRVKLISRAKYQDATTDHFKAYKQWMADVTAGLETFANGLSSRPGPRGLRKEDMRRLLDVCENL